MPILSLMFSFEKLAAEAIKAMLKVFLYKDKSF